MLDTGQRKSVRDGDGIPDTRIIRRLLRFSWRHRGRVIQVFLLQVLLLAVTLGGLDLTGLAIDLVRHVLDSAAAVPHWPLGVAPPSSWSSVAVLCAIGVAVGVMALLRALLNYWYSIAVGLLMHQEIVPGLRSLLFARLQRLSFRFFDANAAGSIINRITRDVQLLRSFVDGVVIQGAVLALALGVFLTYMLATHATLTLVSLASTPLLYIVTTIFSRWAQPAYRENRKLSDFMVRSMAEGIEGIQVAKVFGRENEQYAAFQARNVAYRDQQQKIFKNVSRFTPGIDLLSQLNIVILLAYGGVLIHRAELSLGKLVVFAGLLQQFASRVSAMAGIINTLQQSMTGARRVFEVLDTPVEIENPETPIYPARFRGEVTFEQVSFAYRGVASLDGITLQVSPGTCVGILGATGSGKSTLLSLIPRFYDPTSGSIGIDGIDLRRLDVDSLRRQIGIVFQETFLFRDTIANNIAFGNPEATREQIERAARLSGAHAFIVELPRGYDTRLEEGATNLSGGQRQRLAIARAIVLDPAILILDDPTTAIDAHTEIEVLEAVESAVAGRTTFIVSSRLSTLRRADTVIVLQAGRIVEQGTHRELLAMAGLYREAAELQGVAANGPELEARAS